MCYKIFLFWKTKHTSFSIQTLELTITMIIYSLTNATQQCQHIWDWPSIYTPRIIVTRDQVSTDVCKEHRVSESILSFTFLIEPASDFGNIISIKRKIWDAIDDNLINGILQNRYLVIIKLFDMIGYISINKMKDLNIAFSYFNIICRVCDHSVHFNNTALIINF